jgi:hypothetical protein
MCTQYSHHTYPTIPFFHLLPTLTGTNPRLPQAGPFLPSYSPILQMKKKMTFLFKRATQGVSLWHFHVYMYYNGNWFISSIFLLCTLVPFLWWFHQL